MGIRIDETGLHANVADRLERITAGQNREAVGQLWTVDLLWHSSVFSEFGIAPR